MVRLLHRPAVQALVLSATAGLVGLLVNAVRSDGIPLDRPVLAASGSSGAATCALPAGALVEIDREQARLLHAAGAAFVDARQPGAYAEGHVPEALHLASLGESPDAPRVLEQLRGATTVVVYDDGASCDLARQLGARLLQEGLADVRVMIGGFTEWQAAGEAAQSGTCEACARVAEEER